MAKLVRHPDELPAYPLEATIVEFWVIQREGFDPSYQITVRCKQPLQNQIVSGHASIPSGPNSHSLWFLVFQDDNPVALQWLRAIFGPNLTEDQVPHLKLGIAEGKRIRITVRARPWGPYYCPVISDVLPE